MTDRPSTGRRVTMTDVARAAGVSAMTVSYAFNHPARVAPDTRTRVLEAAARMGYAGPHPGARSLRRGRTATLGVVLGEHLTYAFDDPQATSFLAGVAATCVERHLGLLLIPVTGGPDDGDRVREAGVDAFVVWTTTADDPALEAVAARGLPAVVHGGPAVDGMGLVTIDDQAAARAVGAAVFANSRHPAVLSFPRDRTRNAHLVYGLDPESVAYPVTRARLTGYAEAATAAGLAWEDVPVLVLARNDTREAEGGARRLLGEVEPAVDAIAAMSDELALGVLRAADATGLVVPADLCVGGWDDTLAAAAAGLTTISQALREQGQACAQAVIDTTRPVPDLSQAWHLIERSSTRQPSQ